jgi:hypothetical protein
VRRRRDGEVRVVDATCGTTAPSTITAKTLSNPSPPRTTGVPPPVVPRAGSSEVTTGLVAPTRTLAVTGWATDGAVTPTVCDEPAARPGSDTVARNSPQPSAGAVTVTSSCPASVAVTGSSGVNGPPPTSKSVGVSAGTI